MAWISFNSFSPDTVNEWERKVFNFYIFQLILA